VGQNIPIGDQLGQLWVAVAGEQLDGIRCHVWLCVSAFTASSSSC